MQKDPVLCLKNAANYLKDKLRNNLLIMKQYYFFILLLFSALMFTGCEAIGDIFKAGMWTGILAVVLLVAAAMYFLRRSK